jgi:hypothetical protein
MLILMSNMFNVPVGIHEQFRNGVVYELGYLVRSGVVDGGVSTLCKRLFEMFKCFFLVRMVLKGQFTLNVFMTGSETRIDGTFN